MLTGNPGKRPLPVDEPTPTGVAVKPKWLRGRASKVWDEYAPRYVALGVLTDADEVEFARWCMLLAKLLKDGPDDFPATLHTQLTSLAARFGMDAPARTRLGAARKAKKNPFAELTG